MSRQQHLVSVAWLADAVASTPAPGELVIVDCRWYLDGRDGRAIFHEGHIPGARFVDLDRELAGEVSADGAGGRHPLPDLERFADTLSRLGVRRDGVVVAYDDRSGAIAARLWWLLRYVGLDGGRVLDGGIDAWIAAGHDLERGEEAAAAPVDRLELAPRPRMTMDAGAVAARPAGTVLLDARAPERFRGDTEPVDPAAGHIPGATNIPWSDNVVQGRLAPDEELRATYRQALEAEAVAVYCGSGVTACHDLLALSILGRDDAKLYVGSWSDWCSDPGRPVATGER